MMIELTVKKNGIPLPGQITTNAPCAMSFHFNKNTYFSHVKVRLFIYLTTDGVPILTTYTA